MKVSYEWLQSFFAESSLPPAAAVAEKLVFHAYEIEDVADVNGTAVLDVDVLPNRSSDSLSHRGIAREVSALFEIPMARDPLRTTPELQPQTDAVTVQLDPDASCSYYVAAHIQGVTIGESPAWLKERLAAIGQKPINNVVDATNYVLFELGQPTHVFDARKLSGAPAHIATRRARDGEHITLLGEALVQLDTSMTVIVDGTNDTPLAVAGVKGGTAAEVTDDTVDIIVESALFDPVATRKTAQALKLRTDASTRFENRVPAPLPAYGAQALAALIVDSAGGTCTGFTRAGGATHTPATITVTTAHIARLLGASIDADTVAGILDRLQCTYTHEAGSFTVTPPFERTDLVIPEDIIEEIGRVYGYSTIESAQLAVPPERPPHLHKKYAYAERIRAALDAVGCTEVYLYSLRDSGDVELRNALASDKDHLRACLADGITETLDANEPRMPLLGLYDAVRVYEIGTVFAPETEATHVAVGVRVAGTKKRAERTAAAFAPIRDALQGVLGADAVPEPDGEVIEINLDALLDTLPDVDAYPEGARIDEAVSYCAPSSYPFVLRDIAVWVPDATATDELTALITTHGGTLLQRIDLFDVFSKDGRTSYAFHLVFQSREKTLTDAAVGTIMDALESDISRRDGWEVR